MCAAVFMHDRILHDQAGQTVVRLHGSHESFHVEHSLQSAATDVRHRQIGAGPVLDLPILIVCAVRELNQLSAIGVKDGCDLVTNGLLKSRAPIVAVNDDVRTVFFQIFFVAELGLIDYLIHACNILKQLLPFGSRHKRQSFIGNDRFVRKNADDQLSQFLRLFNDGDMTAVDDIRGEAHVNDTRFDFPELCRYDRQILRVIDLGTEQILHIKHMDVRRAVQHIQRILGIHLCIARLAECDDLIQPQLPIFSAQFVQRLRFHSVLENIHTNLHHLAILDLRFEILFGQRQCRGNGHAGTIRRHNAVKDLIFKNQIPMHQDDIIVKMLPCAVNGIDIIGLVIYRVFDKCNPNGQIKAVTVFRQHIIVISGRHDNLFNPGVRDHF